MSVEQIKTVIERLSFEDRPSWRRGSTAGKMMTGTSR